MGNVYVHNDNKLSQNEFKYNLNAHMMNTNIVT